MKKKMLFARLALGLLLAMTAAPLVTKGQNGLNISQAISDGQIAGDQNSYTKKLIEGLSGKGDLNNDGEVSLKELQLFFEVDALNPKSSLARQIPLSFIGSNFTLFKKLANEQFMLNTGTTGFINIAIDKYQDQ